LNPSILKTERPPVTCARSNSYCGRRNRPTAPPGPSRRAGSFLSHFMKTSGPAGLAKPRDPGAPCRRRSSAMQDRDEDVRHRSHSPSQRDGRAPIATAWRPFLPVRASASHVACQRGQSKCVVKFAIAQLITNKPVTPTGYLRFPVATDLFRSNVEHAKRL
jgi:hypothetical protein